MACPFEFVKGSPLQRALPAIRWLKIGAYAPPSMCASRAELLYDEVSVCEPWGLWMQVRFGYCLVLLGALLWGSVGVFSRTLGQMGLTAMEVAALRMFVASIFLVPILLAMGADKDFERAGRRGLLRLFRISPQGLFWSVLVGVFGLALSSATYYIAIEHIGMSTSSVLMRTSPMFGIVLGRILYVEGITNQKSSHLFSTSRVAHLPSRAARSRSSRYPQLELEWAFALA